MSLFVFIPGPNGTVEAAKAAFRLRLYLQFLVEEESNSDAVCR